MNIMNQLNCSVDNCEHYKNGYCSLSKIQISSLNGSNPDSVLCNNYVQKLEDSSRYSKLECPYTNIQCDMHNCKHNYEGNCEASQVDMYRRTNEDLQNTGCHSFKMRI